MNWTEEKKTNGQQSSTFQCGTTAYRLRRGLGCPATSGSSATGRPGAARLSLSPPTHGG